MDFLELVKGSRSCRGFDRSRAVTEEELRYLADCARLAPSSVNAQPLKYYLAWEGEEVAAIQALTKWGAALPQLTLPHPGMEPPAFLVICLDRAVGADPAAFQKDVGITAQTMLLAAASLGLAGCCIGNFDPEKLARALELPRHICPQLVLGIGRSAERVILTRVGEDGSTRYYRDDGDVHYVPKRALEDVVLTRDRVKNP